MLDELKAAIEEYFVEKAYGLCLDEYAEYHRERYDKHRHDMNFISGFLEYTKHSESPESFLRWAAIATVGATMRDNVYLDVGAGERVYPNLYLILVARSGACRKGFPLKVSKRLIDKIGNTKIIAGRTSIQAVVSDLSRSYTAQMGGGHGLMQGASGLLYSEELAAFMVDDKATIPILTDLYDYHEKWTNNLKSTETETLKNVCLSMISASNETFLKEVYTKSAIYGGLLARTILVLEQKRRQKNARIRRQETAVDEQMLVASLRKVAAMKGTMAFDDAAADCYESWYNSIDDDSYESKSGVEARMHTTVLKVAMCLAAAEPDPVLVVREVHVIEAIDLCIQNLKNYKFMTMGTGQSKISAPGTAVLTELLKEPGHELTRVRLLQRLWGEVDALTLDQVINTMQGGGLLSIVVGGKDGQSYRLTERCIELYKQTAGKRTLV